MNWMFYAIMAPLLWAGCNILDSFIRDKHIKDSVALGIFATIIGSVILLILPIIGISLPDKLNLILALTAGALWTSTLFLYFKALSLEEASRVAPLFSLAAVFTLILSVVFLGEQLLTRHYIAFFLIMLGSFLVSTRRIEGIFNVNKAVVKIMILNEFIYASGLVLLKIFYRTYDLWTGMFWTSLGGLLVVLILLLFKRIRRRAVQNIPQVQKRVFLLFLFSAMIGVTGKMAMNYAILLGPVSLVTVIGGTQAMFVLIIATILSKFKPGLLKEVYERKTLLTKAIAILLIIAGLYFLNA